MAPMRRPAGLVTAGPEGEFVQESVIHLRRARKKPCRFGRLAMAAFSLFAASTAHGDVLKLRNAVAYEGSFTGFKQDKFHFQPRDGKEIVELRVKVDELKLDPPANVIVKPHGKKKRDDLKLIGYGASTFRFSAGGQVLSMTSPTVTSIEMGLDFNRAVAAGGAETLPGSNGELDIGALVEPGLVTVVHFHMASVVSSVRQGNYIAALAGDSKGKAKVVKIELTSFDAAMARKYGIASAPQFWFYSRAGKLVKKLTERFTEEDIDQALKEAMR